MHFQPLRMQQSYAFILLHILITNLPIVLPKVDIIFVFISSLVLYIFVLNFVLILLLILKTNVARNSFTQVTNGLIEMCLYALKIFKVNTTHSGIRSSQRSEFHTGIFQDDQTLVSLMKITFQLFLTAVELHYFIQANPILFKSCTDFAGGMHPRQQIQHYNNT